MFYNLFKVIPYISLDVNITHILAKFSRRICFFKKN